MAKVILDVPAEKMKSFIQLVIQLGLDKHTIASESKAEMPKKKSIHHFHSFAEKYLLFDWEFFSNELEFE